MALSTQPYKGARDFYPEDKRFQKYLFKVMRSVCEQYGYEEYDAPILEPLELYLAKSGQEIASKQTYAFEDRGGRQVTIRPEMTPTVSRMVAAKRHELAFPLRWYSIPNLWRYERPQRGRLREHWQLNVDIFGGEGLGADQEIIELADQIMRKYGAKRDMYTIKLNSRKLMNEFLGNILGLDETQASTMSHLIDRMHKMSRPEFVGQADAIFSPSQRESGVSQQLFAFLEAPTMDDLPEAVQQLEPAKGLRSLINSLHANKLTNAAFDPTVMRGFDYYTDIVFEVFDNDPQNNRSMFGGGRYDSLVSIFGVEPIATVGFGMGDVTLANFLETHGLMPKLRSETDIYVVTVGEVIDGSRSVADELRRMGINVAMDIGSRPVDKQIKTAAKKSIRYALFVGEQELASKQFVLRDLQKGEQETHSLERIASIVKDYRSK